MMQPARPISGQAAATSSSVVTPPEAMTGSGTAAAISAIASTFGPLQHAVAADVGIDERGQGPAAQCRARSSADISETSSQPSVATWPSLASMPERRSGPESGGTCFASQPGDLQRPRAEDDARDAPAERLVDVVFGAQTAAELAGNAARLDDGANAWRR